MNPELHTDLGPIPTTPKTGREKLHADKTPVEGFTLQDFWAWSVSDLVSNATRGRLAEFIVATALGIETSGVVRDEWEAFDLLTPDGKKIQVKSAAYVQSWYQEKLSSIIFSTAKTRYWDAKTNKMEKEAKHQAEVYVFALLAHKDKPTIDPLNVSQWKFYVVSTAKLDAYKRSDVSITLKSLEDLSGGAVDYFRLKNQIECALA
ncbi:MAG: hypothetical protein ABSA47_03640 [Verrucomicrobiota bacterium]|jgi:hypothetical protein